MSTRGGNDKKKGQKYQNSFAFKHNKNSLLTRKIRESPLDLLCKRCVEKLEWRIFYRKYKPLSSAGICNQCEGRNIYKAYRFICDKCAIDGKVCSKCTLPVEEYAKPTNRRNDPNAKSRQNDPLDEIVKDLKVRHKRTIERKIREGEYLVFDKEKGIINDDTGVVVVDIKCINGGYDVDSDPEKDADGEDDKNEEKNELENKSNQVKESESDQGFYVEDEDEFEEDEEDEIIKNKSQIKNEINKK